MERNKDFIHIDELFKDLKNTVDDSYRSEDAWSRMKSMLDEEMPVADPVGRRGNRRYFIPLLALMLGAGGVATGYYVHKNGLADTGVGTTIVQNNNGATTGNLSEQAMRNTQHSSPTENTLTADATTISEQTVALYPYATASGKGMQQHSTSAPTGNHITSEGTTKKADKARWQSDQRHGQVVKLTTATNAVSAVSDQGEDKELLKSLLESQSQDLKGVSAGLDKQQSPEVMSINTKDDIKNATGKVSQPQPLSAESITPKVMQQPDASGKSESGLVNNDKADRFGEGKAAIEPAKRIGNSEDPKQVIVKNGKKYIQTDAGWFEEKQQKQTIVHTERTTNNQHQLVVDTQSVEEQFVTKRLPLEKELVKSLNLGANTDAVAANADINDYTDLRVLNDTKVKSYTGEAKGSNFFKKYILKDDVRRWLNTVDKFEAMITFGGLYSPAATGSYGFSVGVGGVYNLTERLNVVMEARYVRKVFSNFYQEDEERAYDVTQNGSIYSGVETTTKYEYTIRNYNSIEIPLYLSYEVGDRLSVFGGIQYVYAAPIKWSLDKEITTNVNFASIAAPQNKSVIVNQNEDFGPRSGFGFLAGVGFDASRRISIDFRVSQNFYNKKNISSNSINGIYNAPVFGLTLGYFFGKSEKIYYIMKNR